MSATGAPGLDTFVDALCEPPETFTFGGMFAHVITFNAYRRMVAIDVLRGFGVKVEGVGVTHGVRGEPGEGVKPASPDDGAQSSALKGGEVVSKGSCV